MDRRISFRKSVRDVSEVPTREMFEIERVSNNKFRVHVL